MILRFNQELCNTVFPSEMEVTDNEGNVSSIRLIHGTTEVEVSKQPENFRLKEFKTGFANVVDEEQAYYQTEITDKAILNFLQATPYWGKYIKEYDPLEVNKAKSESLNKQVTLMMEITQMSDDDLLALGYSLIGKNALEFAKNKDIEGLRLEVARKTQEEPDTVDALKNDKNNADRLMLGLAFAKGVLVETEAGNSVSWGHNDVPLIKVPKGLMPIDAVLEHFDTPEGKEDKKIIFEKLKQPTGRKGGTTSTEKTQASKVEKLKQPTGEEN